MFFNKTILTRGLPIVLTALLAACGGGSGTTATVVTPGKQAIAAAIGTSVPAATCPTGGIAINTGIDSNSNGTLDASEISNTQYVCNGTAAANALMSVTDEPAGANCAAGGKKISVGLDTDNSGALDVAEVTSSSYICNGATGATGPSGSNGLNTLVSTSGEAPGANCVYGGIKVNSGLDSNNNGTLDANEITSTDYACNVSVGSGGFAWVDVTASSVQAASNMGYMANSASMVSVTLPAAPAVGDVVKVTGIDAGGWSIVANAGQFVHTSSITGNPTPSTSISGAQGESIELLYVGNAQFAVLNYTGTPTTVLAPSSTIQTYTASAGIGEVLQFDINTINLTYAYKVLKTSYAASGVSIGQTGSGTMTSAGNGMYTLSATGDSFIQNGKLLPKSDSLLSGHIQISSLGGANQIPVIGLSNPLQTLSSLAGTYNFQGFLCNAPGVANVAGNPACSTTYGTISIDASGNISKCNFGDITTDPAINPCVTIQTRTLQTIASTPGVFDFINPATGHAGWLFAFTAANGQKVAILDNDDTISSKYGHAVLSTYASTVSGTVNGNIFKNDNESNERVVTINGTSYSNDLGFTGTINYNAPWNGLSTFQVASGVLAVSGVSMTSTTGIYSHLVTSDPAFFSVGMLY